MEESDSSSRSLPRESLNHNNFLVQAECKRERERDAHGEKILSLEEKMRESES